MDEFKLNQDGKPILTLSMVKVFVTANPQPASKARRIMAADVVVGEGTVLFPGCVLDVGARIGNNCVLNSSVTVAHDSCIDDHSMCGPGVALAGLTHIQHSCFLGIGTIVSPRPPSTKA